MFYYNFDQITVPVEGRYVVVPELQSGEPRTFDYSMAFARMLAPRAVLLEQYHTAHPDARDPVSCAICWVDGDRHRMTPLPCGHRFHGDCIRKWFEVQSHRSPTCPTCRRIRLEKVLYKRGHLIDGNGAKHSKLWRPDEPAVNHSFVSPKRHGHGRAAASPMAPLNPPRSASDVKRNGGLSNEKQSYHHASSDKSTKRPRRHRRRRLRAAHMMGERPLGWIIAWALDGAKMVSAAGIPVVENEEEEEEEGHGRSRSHHPPVVMLDSPTWDEHLILMLRFLRQLAESELAERKLEKFWASFRDLDEALETLRRCEKEAEEEEEEEEEEKGGKIDYDSDDEEAEPTPINTSYHHYRYAVLLSPASSRLWAARVAWSAAFDKAQRHLEYFLALEEVLDAGKKLYSTLDWHSGTATYVPWLWRHRRRRLGLLPDDTTPPPDDFARLRAYCRRRVGKWL